MEKRTVRLYPSAPLEKIGLEGRLGKKLNDVNIFDNHINNIEKGFNTSKTKTKNPKVIYLL